MDHLTPHLHKLVGKDAEKHADNRNLSRSLLFVLAVLFISRLTDGYVYGIVASFSAVLGVNYMFTYP